MRKSRYKLIVGQPGYGRVCPECGGGKRAEAFRCGECRRRRGDEGIYSTGRDQSIITFRRTEDGRVRSLQCFGPGAKAQIEDGKARLGDGDWVVECRSTPLTILRDLRPEGHGEQRALMLKRGIT